LNSTRLKVDRDAVKSVFDFNEQARVAGKEGRSGGETESRLRGPRIIRVSIAHVEPRKTERHLFILNVGMMEIKRKYRRRSDAPAFEALNPLARWIATREIAAK